MIVSSRELPNVLKKLHQSKLKSIDTETTGLKWYDDDRIFSIIIADENESYYFNFDNTPDHLGSLPPQEFILDRMQMASFQTLFDCLESTWFIHNAKFDLSMLAKEGLEIFGRVHCTETVARLLDGRFKSYKLADCVKRMNKELRLLGNEKLDSVEKYIRKHKLFDKITIEGKKKAIEEKHFDLVPFDIIVEYGLQDGRVGFNLGMYQKDKLDYLVETRGLVGFKEGYERETRLTKVCLKMEREGIHLDRGYTEKSLDHFRKKIKDVEAEFEAIAGKPLIDSAKELVPVFNALGAEFPRTEKGNPSFKDEVLSQIDHPIGSILQNYREARKLMSSYYSNFLYRVSKTGKIHCEIKQNGASRTQRMSIINPALQTIPKETDPNDPWNVRRCFVPPEGWCLFSPDNDQMEYRMLLDQAEEMSVIRAVLNGLDVHTATAEKMSCTRQEAKTINFLLLYGGGPEKLAASLGISLEKAQILYKTYFLNLKNVGNWTRKTIAQATHRGHVKNSEGMISFVFPKYEYAATNYYIQGGCAQVMKKAMLAIAEDMERKRLRSKMILQLHDELLFAMHPDELDYCPKIVGFMESAYQYKHLPLTAGPAYSWKSWGDKQDGYPKRNAA